MIQVVRSKAGRVYEYDYSTRQAGRKSSVHHPDFKYKEVSDCPYSDLNRQRCLERDTFTCQICGCGPIGDLDVHHKDGRSPEKSHNQANNSLSNLITLCTSCHQILHYGTPGNRMDTVSRRENGEALQIIANSYGLTRQRVHQIIMGERLKKERNKQTAEA